jgi:hypothetical protein
MIYLAYGVMTIWFVGFVGISFNDTRLVLNNLAPGTDIWKNPGRIVDYDPFQFRWGDRAVVPEDLTETGRQYLKRARRRSRIASAWMITGFFLIAAVFSFA